MTLNLKNKKFLITGGTGGIGKVIVNDLSACGAEVIILSSMDYNFSNPTEVNQLLLYISNSLGHIDGYINCVGVLSGTPEYVYNTNLITPIKIIDTCIQKMKENQFGRIVNIGSIAASQYRIDRHLYSSSKAGVIAACKSYGIQYAPYGILINSISPGPSGTDMLYRTMSEDKIASLKKIIPTQNLINIDDISTLTCFLASHYNTSINSQDIKIDGGLINKAFF